MIEPASVSEAIYSRLEAAILSGHFKPRERLVERTLEREFNVSRTPVREALKQLQYAGLVQVVSGGGLMVRDVNPTEVFNLYMVRLPLEKLAIETMPVATDDDLRRLNAILDALDEAFETRDFPKMVALNMQLHREFTALTGNGWLLSTLEQIRRQCYLVVQHGPVAERAGLAVSLAEHRRMVDLLAHRDLVGLTTLTFQHILRSALFYLRRGATIDRDAEIREGALREVAEHLLHEPPLKLRAFERREPAEQRFSLTAHGTGVV